MCLSKSRGPLAAEEVKQRGRGIKVTVYDSIKDCSLRERHKGRMVSKYQMASVRRHAVKRK